MIRINEIKLDVGHSEEELRRAIEKKLRLYNRNFTYELVKMSYDCRIKHPLKVVYSVEIRLDSDSEEEKLVKKIKNKNIMSTKRVEFNPIVKNVPSFDRRPIVIGTGPAGLFCGYILALNGFNPILLERGKCVEERFKDVDAFWQEKEKLNPDSNVQFGEGGAGTFSDGKLNTSAKDKNGQQRFILKSFVECGAPEDILYLSNPHIGTDYLKNVVSNLRKKIIALGGEIHFSSKVVDFIMDKNGIEIKGVVLEDGSKLLGDHVVLAIGHSARDTFEMLLDKGVHIEQKPFAVGIRIEHPRTQIDALQYKEHYGKVKLPTANYKMTYHASNKRSVFTFCMCPGGYVVNASSEEGCIVVNGMSNHARMADNSNSAVVASVTPDDYKGESPLAGIDFQRQLEQAAFIEGKGRIPIQLFEDFKNNTVSTEYGGVKACTKGAVAFGNIRRCLPESISSAIIEAVCAWDKNMPGYARADSLVLGVESRTSSPVKIVRNKELNSNIKGLYPCGEGAGYAGGIMSAAQDGIRVAMAVIKA